MQALKAHFLKIIDPDGKHQLKESENKPESILTRDFVRTMSEEFERDLDQAYQFNKAFARHLTQKVNNLQQFERQKRSRLMQQQVKRLLMIRNDSSYKHHINVFIREIQKEAHH